VKGINIGEVRKIQIPLPPKSKQDELASKLELLTEAQSTTAKHNELQRILLRAMSEVLFGSGISTTFTKSNSTDKLSSILSHSSD
jgi:restriction endonuclease S subunit